MMIIELLNKMTIREKIGQLNLRGTWNDDTITQIIKGEIGSLLNVRGYEKVKAIQKVASIDSRLKIPLLFGEDVIHGYKTIFPIPIAEACSWNLLLIEENAHLTKLEASSEGINWIYAPMVDITHDPRWGRVMETAGEDPYLGSLIAKSKVKGIQRRLSNQNIVASCAKHYLGYGAVEAGLDYNTTDFSEYRMRNLYLPPFKAAINQGVLSIMNAFTTYQEMPVTTSKYLLRDVLRHECRFNHVVVSDWSCLEQVPKHGVASDLQEASEMALIAGIDIDMHSKTYVDYLAKAIEENPLLLPLLDEAVLRVLKMKEQMGLFKNPYSETIINDAIHHLIKQKAKATADESIILLKNENGLLPLKDYRQKILVIGPYLFDQDIHLGAWSCQGDVFDVVSLQSAFEKTSYDLTYCHLNHDEIDDLITKECELADQIIVTLGEPRHYSGENNSRQSLNLPYKQDELVDFLAKFNKPIIAIVFSGRPLSITKLDKVASSILWCWHLGHFAGTAIIDVITGKVNPSAKTVVTFPKSLGQVPIYYNNYSTGRSEIQQYVDGEIKPLYPFGFGLNYGQIKYHSFEPSYDQLHHKINVKIVIENENNILTKEVVQVYLSILSSKILRPKIMLAGFQKTTFEGFEKKVVEIQVDLINFLSLDEISNGQKLSIMVGPSSIELIKKDIII